MRVLLETTMWWPTLSITESVFPGYHPLSILWEHGLTPATTYGHPVTLLARLSVNLREILGSVNNSLMCPAAAYQTIAWRWQTLSYTSDKWCIRFLAATLVVDLRLLKLELILRVLQPTTRVIIMIVLIQDAWTCIVQDTACHRGIRWIILRSGIRVSSILYKPILYSTFDTVAYRPASFLDLHRVLVRVLGSIISIFAGIIFLVIFLLVCVVFADYVQVWIFRFECTLCHIGQVRWRLRVVTALLDLILCYLEDT